MKWIAVLMAISLFAGSVSAQAATFIQNGQTNYRIIIPEKKSPAVEYAAGELQQFLLQVTGVRLPVVIENEAGNGPAFLVGPCERSQKAGLVERASKLREDGVLIKTTGEDLALLGQNERGNVYSVYVFLEKYLGVRYLAWDCTVVPKQDTLSLPDIDYSYAPPFMYRETLYKDSYPKEIAARQRLNGPYTKCDETVGGKIEFFPYVHSFDDLFPEKEYFKTHPEYYGLVNGKRVAGDVHAQLCLTNPDVLRLAKEKVLKWIDEHPNVPIIDVSQNDGNGACECENCMKIVNEEGSQHGPILRFVNAIADEVAKKHPDKWVETLSYAYSLTPPAHTRPRPNVLIRLCHAGCYFHGFEKCKMGSDFAGVLDQWSSVTQRIFIWHYAADFAHYLAPNPNLGGLAKDIKYYAAHNVNGLMVQAAYQGHGGELAELRQYLAAQLMWDPSRDPMEIRSEFCKGYYEDASGAVLEFLRLMDQVADKGDIHAFGSWDPQDTVSPQLVENSLKVLEQATSATQSPTVQNRIEKLMLPFWYMKLTYPAKYGLSEADAPALWKRTRQLLSKNGIIYFREAAAHDQHWVDEMDANFAPKPKDMVYDLLQIGRATTQNCPDWRLNSVDRNGHTLRAIFHHPHKSLDSDATYEVALPALANDKKLVMKFGTVITNKTRDGVRYAVLANGKELWNFTQKTFKSLDPDDAPKGGQDSILPGQDPYAFHEVDLSAYAGQTVRLTLRVNPLEDKQNDWSNWVEPAVWMVSVK